jgi:Trypsin-like peptidase domain
MVDMPLLRRPTSVIIPIALGRVESERRAGDILGTAFLVGPNLFMSAHHVLGVEPAPGQTLAALLVDGEHIGAYAAELVFSDPHRDIALARVEDWPVTEHLPISNTDELFMNQNVLTIEYSPTRTGVPMPDGDSGIDITANWHKGNMVRQYRDDFGRGGMVRCINLSYPAFKRASGAPVHEATGHVLGMILSNIESELSPAHLERIELPDGTAHETVRYFLPSARAIHASHLRQALIAYQGSGD